MYKDGISVRCQLLHLGSPQKTGMKGDHEHCLLTQGEVTCRRKWRWAGEFFKCLWVAAWDTSAGSGEGRQEKLFFWLSILCHKVHCCIAAVNLVTLWGRVISVNQGEWVFLHYGNQCLPCLILLNSHHEYCKQDILPYAINIKKCRIENGSTCLISLH